MMSVSVPEPVMLEGGPDSDGEDGEGAVVEGASEAGLVGGGEAFLIESSCLATSSGTRVLVGVDMDAVRRRRGGKRRAGR